MWKPTHAERSLLGILLSLCCCASCHPSSLRLPLTAERAARHDSGEALVVYLSQTDASSTFCELERAGPNLRAFTPTTRRLLLDGLREGTIAPQRFRRCVEALFRELPPSVSAQLLTALMQSYQSLTENSALEEDPALAERLLTLHELYVHRSSGLEVDARELSPLLDELRTGLAEKELTSIVAALASELLASRELEHGRWRGQLVDTKRMDELAEAGNELTLTRFLERLPSQQLRHEARLRKLRVHIRLSPFAEVQSASTALEAKLLKRGGYPVSLIDHPLLRARLEASAIASRVVVVRQDVWRGAATLLGIEHDGAEPSILPEVPLRGALHAELRGISREVSLCDEPEALDPSPCLELAELALGTPLAELDRTGTIHLREEVSAAEVLPLASDDGLLTPIQLGGAHVATLSWALYFERPKDLTFAGLEPSEKGPDLRVKVSFPGLGRVRFDVRADGHGYDERTYSALLEERDVSSFRIWTRGAPGERGSPGSPGSSGSPGIPCSNGGDGGSGGWGGPGGPGGDGGSISIVLACGQESACGSWQELLRQIVRSEGGEGGPGGLGGAGGPGGSGGSGRPEQSHTDQRGGKIVDDPGCSAGSPGASGTSGFPGPAGRDGQPGDVSFQIVGAE